MKPFLALFLLIGSFSGPQTPEAPFRPAIEAKETALGSAGIILRSLGPWKRHGRDLTLNLNTFGIAKW